ncbi:hypothetical protein Hpkin61_14790 [Helicobacter pylori]
MKAFVVDLDSNKNQIMLKPSTPPFSNQAHQVSEVAEKIHELIKNAPYSNDNIVLNAMKSKKPFLARSNRS